MSNSSLGIIAESCFSSTCSFTAAGAEGDASLAGEFDLEGAWELPCLDEWWELELCSEDLEVDLDLDRELSLWWQFDLDLRDFDLDLWERELRDEERGTSFLLNLFLFDSSVDLERLLLEEEEE